jgi:tRNA (guanosine-2'-O-)-methyltransferase
MSLSYSQKIALIDYFSNFTSERRMELLRYVLDHRTRYITVVLEDIFQSQNASAVLRSCDCFGVQDVHVIENYNKFNVNPKVVMGASKWLTLNKYNNCGDNTLVAINALKQQGYRIVATSPHTYVTSLQDFDVDRGKFAILFGTELTGLSEVALDNADEFLMIPTYGFSESLNISVSAALCLQNLTERLRISTTDYKLAQEEYADVLLEWLRKSIKSWRSIEKRFLSSITV